jgi:hypothetical protein
MNDVRQAKKAQKKADKSAKKDAKKADERRKAPLKQQQSLLATLLAAQKLRGKN